MSHNILASILSANFALLGEESTKNASITPDNCGIFFPQVFGDLVDVFEELFRFDVDCDSILATAFSGNQEIVD